MRLIKKLSYPVLFVAGVIFNFYALADTENNSTGTSAAEATVASVPTAVTKAEVGGLKVVSVFPAAGDLTGYVLSSRPGENMLVYTPKGHDNILITGRILDGDGSDLSAQYLEKYGTKVDLNKYENMIKEAPAIVEGATGRNVKSKIYVFMDPNCIFCHLAWKALQPYEAAGLQVHWIPMGFLKPDSAGKAAALLDSEDGAKLLAALEINFSEKNESGGILPENIISEKDRKILRENKDLFDKIGFQGTPTILFRDAQGHLASHQGMPKLSTLPYMLSMKLQSVDDPELQRFR
ncbi:thiol:disulfide interchange protein DsbG [Paraburkholderia sp. Ac-20347]|uniref:thiol:disulfide interchange protein DsbG n=1 Tax=Paraburkholderia sp. Ac-20347 TaxID=2703892 RepID=UPI00197F1A94|nr:thiol:disulfide interchange protein DsbG [Paraburkholderia sp. Ac-20347]MBN3812788.1 thiol:disulfide interchange protein DsbG [Paraburkholderia sp. Ac-20347]